MPSDKVLLDIDEAEKIFTILNHIFQVLKDAETTPKDRAPLMRGMIKLKVAINTAKGLYEES